MRWKKLIKILRKNPNLLDPIYQMGEQEARHIALQAEYRHYYEMMENIQRNTTFPKEIWDDILPSIKRSKFRNKIKGLKNISIALPKQRRLAVAGLILLLLTGFFTLIPAGRALARNIFNFVIRITENRMIFEQEGVEQSFPSIHPEEHIIDSIQESVNATEKQDLSSAFEQFHYATGYKAIKLDSDLFELAHAEFGQFGQNYYIQTIYVSNDSIAEISVSQSWFKNPDISNPSVWADDPKFYTREVLSNIPMYCVYDNWDNIFIGTAFIGECELIVTAMEGIDIDLLLSSIIVETR